MADPGADFRAKAGPLQKQMRKFMRKCRKAHGWRMILVHQHPVIAALGGPIRPVDASDRACLGVAAVWFDPFDVVLSQDIRKAVVWRPLPASGQISAHLERYVLMKANSTFPAHDAQTLSLGQIVDAICQGPVLQQMRMLNSVSTGP